MSRTILAIDLGKFNSVFCWYEPTTHAEHYRTVTTTPDELRRELTRRPVASVVFEACSQAAHARRGMKRETVEVNTGMKATGSSVG